MRRAKLSLNSFTACSLYRVVNLLKITPHVRISTCVYSARGIGSPLRETNFQKLPYFQRKLLGMGNIFGSKLGALRERVGSVKGTSWERKGNELGAFSFLTVCNSWPFQQSTSFVPGTLDP